MKHKSSLTPEQQKEAEWAYIMNNIPPADIRNMETIALTHRAYEKAREEYEAARNACSHPLVARVTENQGNTGNWDPSSDCYWTNHQCLLCHMRWTTGQRWKHVGTKLGLPTDEEAKER